MGSLGWALFLTGISQISSVFGKAYTITIKAVQLWPSSIGGVILSGIFDLNSKICHSALGCVPASSSYFMCCSIAGVFSMLRRFWSTELSRWGFGDTPVCEMGSPQVLTPEMPKSLLGSAETNAGGDVHVLAVDDSVIDRRVLEKLLKTSAYKVTAVDSGRKALEVLGVGEARGPLSFSVSSTSCSISPDKSTLEKFTGKEVNLIITDYCMPGMTGYDLLKKVKGTSALKGIPVVVMSSENEPNRINSCLAEGAEEFLLKPVQLADVKRLRVHVRHPPQGTMAASEPDTSCSRRRVIVESVPVRSLERRMQRVCHLS